MAALPPQPTFRPPPQTVVEQLGPQTLSIVLEHNFQKPRSRSIGLGAFLFAYGESIEVDEPWIVRMGRPLEQPGTMNRQSCRKIKASYVAMSALGSKADTCSAQADVR
jgi:hypothetical protein